MLSVLRVYSKYLRMSYLRTPPIWRFGRRDADYRSGPPIRWPQLSHGAGAIRVSGSLRRLSETLQQVAGGK